MKLTQSKNEVVSQKASALFPPHFWRLLLVMGVFSAFILLIVALFHAHLLSRLYMFWNLFLACLPLLLAMAAVWWVSRGKNHIVLAGLFVLWMAFFPNAPYMLTDLVHLRLYDFSDGAAPATFQFTAQPEVWLGFLHIVTLSIIGCVLGCLSLYLMHGLVRGRFGRWPGWVFCAGTCALGGLGVFIGRCLRFNSWDLVHRLPEVLMTTFAQLNWASAATCLLFAAMTFGAYLLFYACYGHDKPS